MWMKTVLAAAGVAVAALTAGTAHAAGASDYLAALYAEGVVGENAATDQALVRLGYSVCAAMNRGDGWTRIAQTIEGGSVTEDKAEIIVIEAYIHLCTQADPPAAAPNTGYKGDRDAVALAADLAAQRMGGGGIRMGGGSVGAAKLAAGVCNRMISQSPAGSYEALTVSVERSLVNEMLENAWRNEKNLLTDNRAWQAVSAAEWHFCPQYS